MKRWNDDPHTKRARKENFQARSVFKLEELDKRESLLKGVKRVLDLGASPGSWSEYCLRQGGSEIEVTAVDLSPLRAKDSRLVFHQKSVDDLLDGTLSLGSFDLVLSDMAPKTSGIHARDVALSIELCEKALAVTEKCLRPGGRFVVKIFMGEGFEDFEKKVSEKFATTRLLRPETTRKHSREIYLVGKDKK